MIDEKKMEILPKYPNQGYKVVFLKEPGMLNTLTSICPVLNDRGEIVYKNYKGHLIHHGETFEIARFFDKKAPFMTYVYKINKYAEESINNYFLNNPMTDDVDLSLKISNECGSFKVLDNINKEKNDRFVGHDSIGCTIFCGEKKVERAFWCGSILSDTDKNVDPNYTPTIVQVAAGVISGLSYIMEPKNKKLGLLEPCDLDTEYILERAIPLLGKFFFTEIPNEHIKDFSFEYKRK
jgi:homospermidine synthase